MASEWITGAFGAGGAAIGASATLAANWLTGRTQEKLERAKRGGANIDLRRTVCAEFLASVYSYIDKTRELIDAAYTRRDDSAADAAREAYMIEWEKVNQKVGPVVIVGPDSVREAANTLRDLLEGAGAIADQHYEHLKTGKRRYNTADFSSFRDELEKELASFVKEVARHTQDPEA